MRAAQWCKKLSNVEKKQGRARADLRRRRLHPSREELRGQVLTYCQNRGLNARVQTCIQELVMGIESPHDPRDQRQVPMSDRVPRSLETKDTYSPHYWSIDYFPPVQTQKLFSVL